MPSNHPFQRRAGVALLIVLTGAGRRRARRFPWRCEPIWPPGRARRTARRLQAEYLAVAGYDLAAAATDTADANYTGQTWDVAAEELGGQDRRRGGD